MDVSQKLMVIQKLTGLTQTELATRLSVSFVTFNRWVNGKVLPRQGALRGIDDLFLEVTGQKIIPHDQLTAKKMGLENKSQKYENILSEIIRNTDIFNSFLLKLTYNSNRIEGSTLTEPDTALILFDDISIPKKTVIEHLEVKNHETALRLLFAHIEQKKRFDTDFILKLHAILMNGILPDAGWYRNHAVRILGVNLAVANYIKIPDLMRKVVSMIESTSHEPIQQATAVHSLFEKIHPFADGNGRMGRLLLVGMLLRANLPPAIVRQEQKRLYYMYLYKAQTTDDQSQLEDFFCDATLYGFEVLERLA